MVLVSALKIKSQHSNAVTRLIERIMKEPKTILFVLPDRHCDISVGPNYIIYNIRDNISYKIKYNASYDIRYKVCYNIKLVISRQFFAIKSKIKNFVFLINLKAKKVFF